MNRRQQDICRAHASGKISLDEFERQYLAAETSPAAATKRRRPAKLDREAPVALHTFARAGSQLYHDKRLSDGARRLIAKLIEWARGRGRVDAFVEQLADQLGLCVRALQYAQARAEECGYIAITRTRSGRRNLANSYELLAPCFPSGSAPRRRRVSSSRVQKTAPHQGRELKLSAPSLILPLKGEEKGAPLVAAPVNADDAAPLAAFLPTIAPSGASFSATGRRSSKTVPSAQPPPAP